MQVPKKLDIRVVRRDYKVSLQESAGPHHSFQDNPGLTAVDL